MAYENGAIQTISRNLLDPRRSKEKLKGSSDDMSIPYGPIVFDPNQDISMGEGVLGVQKIVSIPTKLESTTLIVCYGQDVLIATRQPSGGFDTLSEDFSFVQLLASIVSLIAAIIFLKSASERKSIKEAWR